jgi:hypothetical protein
MPGESSCSQRRLAVERVLTVGGDTEPRSRLIVGRASLQVHSEESLREE